MSLGTGVGPFRNGGWVSPNRVQCVHKRNLQRCILMTLLKSRGTSFAKFSHMYQNVTLTVQFLSNILSLSANIFFFLGSRTSQRRHTYVCTYVRVRIRYHMIQDKRVPHREFRGALPKNSQMHPRHSYHSHHCNKRLENHVILP